ncbi:hypothetical protein [Halomicrobium salinisoli]|uniref:hypothetical protein n=1 Tax=Halomicrobium salinisoli TaxID=2878391 RepID=UPI001CF0B3AD|nr:hypothetical protein [Halomicrobium salinisoli]
MDTIGVIAEPDHAVFGRVAERLAARGFEVRFFEPGEPIDDGTVAGLAALVNGRLRRRSLAALRTADRRGVETWNGFLPSSALSCRLVAHRALEAVGCDVPDVRVGEGDGDGGAAPRDTSDGRYVARGLYDWDPPADADRLLYRERIGDDAVHQKYYAVDDGVETHVTAVAVRSELTDDERAIGEADVAVQRATRVRELLDRFGARALAVEFVEDGDDAYAVDVDAAPSFVGAGMDRRIADSMASLTTIGA